MLKGLISKVFGTRHEREARKLQPIVDEINSNVEELKLLSDEALRGQTEKLRGIVRERTAGPENELAELRQTKRQTEDADERNQLALEIQQVETRLKEELQSVLDDILPEAYATVKEACRRLMAHRSRSPTCP
jgi:preprotein translocase subunit SecA